MMDMSAEAGLMDDPQSDARAVPVSPAGYACGPVPNGVAMLEAEIVRLRALLNCMQPLSASWHHLPDVTAPPPRTMPARALFCKTQQIGIR